MIHNGMEEDVLSELTYPFDVNYILSKKKRIKRELLELDRKYVTKKVAILGGYTTSEIKNILELFLLFYGIQAEFYESEYNHYYEDAVFDNEDILRFAPDIIYVCTSNRNIMKYPDMLSSCEEIELMLKTELDRYQLMWSKLYEKYCCPIIQNNFELPMFRLLGNKDASDVHGAVNFITRLNMEFYQFAQKHPMLHICDINYISADYGLKEWSDPFYWYMYKYALNVSAIPYLAYNVASIIKSIFGLNKKGYVLDLDNTLWGGVIGDDGIDNIEIGLETAQGEAYLEFQNYLKMQKQLGVLLNVNSKNEQENALEGLNHENCVLRPADFVEIVANWDNKDNNCIKIADKLGILPDSLVFVDDNPAERDIVKKNIDSMSVPEIGQAHQYIQVLDRSAFFELTNYSEDDLHRNQMYQDNVKRQQFSKACNNYEEYLQSLEMIAQIEPFRDIYLSRIAQLTNKSNQFNLTTKRYTKEEIESISRQNDYITLYARLRDRFGDNGVVSVVIGQQKDEICHVKLWLMSCRVLKRDLEYAMMDSLVTVCKDRGISQIRGYYYPTDKNGMVKEFYGLLGFVKKREDTDGNAVWEYVISDDYKKKNINISVEENENE